jgi:hypothetical protein
MSFYDYLSLSFPKQLLSIHVGKESDPTYVTAHEFASRDKLIMQTFRESVVIR